MELVLAVVALHRGETSVNTMEDAVTDVALFNAVHLLVDVGLPQEDGRDNISVARLDQVPDRQGPLGNLSLLEFQLLADVNLDALQWVV